MTPRRPRSSSIPVVAPIGADGPLSSREWTRRQFVMTSGGVVLAATGFGALGCDESTGPGPRGTLQVSIIGLAGGLPSAGLATITRTDATAAPVNATLPNLGTVTVDVPVGVYHVIYTPPSGYQVAGANEFDVTITSGQTTSVSVTVEAIPVQGTLHITISGLAEDATSGGSVTAQRTDATASPTVIPVGPTGIKDQVIAAGTYTLTYAAPTDHVLTGENPLTGIVVTDGATVNIVFTVEEQSPGVFAPPNLLNNLSFESGTDGMTAGNLTRVNDHAFDGTWSLRRDWTPSASDVGGNNFFDLGVACGEAWLRFYFRLAEGWSITSILKFVIFREGGYGTQFGGFEIGSPAASAGRAGLSWSSFQEQGSYGTQLVAPENISAGAWHSLEVHNRRNGDAFPNYAFWFDGQQIVKPDGAVPGGHGWAWSGGRLYSNERGTDKAFRLVQFCGTLNGGNTGSGSIWIDRVAASTAGRIGP